MKKSNLIIAFILSVFCYLGCTSPSQNAAENNAQDTNLDDIVETAPEKKVNQAPASVKIDKEGSENKIQTTTGIFASIDSGDYFYLNMKDEKNQETSFTIWQAYEGAAELNVDNWESVRGKKIKVTWQEGMEEIPEANDKMLVKKVIAVEVLK